MKTIDEDEVFEKHANIARDIEDLVEMIKGSDIKLTIDIRVQHDYVVQNHEISKILFFADKTEYLEKEVKNEG